MLITTSFLHQWKHNQRSHCVTFTHHRLCPVSLWTCRCFQTTRVPQHLLVTAPVGLKGVWDSTFLTLYGKHQNSKQSGTILEGARTVLQSSFLLDHLVCVWVIKNLDRGGSMSPQCQLNIIGVWNGSWENYELGTTNQSYDRLGNIKNLVHGEWLQGVGILIDSLKKKKKKKNNQELNVWEFAHK